MFFRKGLKPLAARKRSSALKLNSASLLSQLHKQKNVQIGKDGVVVSTGFVQANSFGNNDKVLVKDGNYVYVYRRSGVYVLMVNMDEAINLSFTVNDDTFSSVLYFGQKLLSCGQGTFLCNKTSFKQITTYCFKSMAVSGDRLFGLGTNNFLYVMSAGEITKAEMSYHLTPHTPVDALVSTDKLYLLGDTCYTLISNAEEIDMKYAPFCKGIGTVQNGSVAVFGKKVIFATNHGLYKLQSNSITPIFSSLNGEVGFDGCVACGLDGKYYLSCKIKGTDSTVNNVLLVLDVEKEQLCGVMDISTQSMIADDGKLYAIVDGRLMCLDQTELDSCYCEVVDFDTAETKHLDKLLICTRTDTELWIGNGCEKRRYKVKGKGVVQRIPICGSGITFTVQAETCGGMGLERVELVAHTCEV